jgi:hypothetical protein
MESGSGRGLWRLRIDVGKHSGDAGRSLTCCVGVPREATSGRVSCCLTKLGKIPVHHPRTPENSPIGRGLPKPSSS